MKIFIVHAHPEPQSFCTAMKDTAVETFQSLGHEVQVSDLHQMNWNPVASSNDFEVRSQPDYLVYALEQREAYKSGKISPDIQAEIDKLKWCDVLIFNFPMYWFSVPAILKGWIDRVFISGFCYGGKRFYDQGGLKGKKGLMAFTLGGREHMFGEDKIHGDMSTMLRPLLRGSMAYVGLSVLPPFIGWHVPYITDEDRQILLKQYREYLTNLDQLEPLSFPSLANFDDRMMPKI
ncbi:NAD(P)H-dependent oxidoreductase [Polynucleobacter sp. 30F-ANTBAC]|uniref:NAD(P)H-dependent oxidoreductase n=1 Tax=Polynucleobacter sp. 30F-ANTBAC TaxID=2689095 RepID=UPI001C0B522E|nr:NAD(P)H-dependent oxidoreductase [Polynucleobacter sp. 30F-ANTBAC]MBU3599863.1 NAD(P)H-dependent oxidoreductase [Polynucleobacter sp. 30F-ANTBAC]